MQIARRRLTPLRMTDLPTWTKRPTPGLSVIEGRRVRLEPLDWETHASGVFAATGGEANVDIWTWMPVGPFPDIDSLKTFLLGQRDAEQ